MTISLHHKLKNALCALTAIWCYGVHAASFQVTGTYKSSTPDADGVWHIQQEIPFVVAVRDMEWSIRLQYGPDWYEEYASNGTNVFYVLHDPGSPVNALPGAIMQDAYPANGTPHATLLWLAFCSTHALDQGMVLPAPWADAQRSPLAYLYKMKLNRYQEPPSLPFQINYITTTERMRSAGSGRYLFREGLNEQDRHLRSFDYETIAASGILGAEYKATEAAHHNGIVVPRQFELVFYEHLRGNHVSESDLVPQIRYQGFVATITNLAETSSLLPAIDRPLGIVDYRLKHEKPIDFIVYSHHGNYWPQAITDAMRSNLAERAGFSLTAMVDQALSVRVVFICLIALAIFLPLLIRLFVRRQARTRNNHSK